MFRSVNRPSSGAAVGHFNELLKFLIEKSACVGKFCNILLNMHGISNTKYLNYNLYVLVKPDAY
jgi:hypothetical protein